MDDRRNTRRNLKITAPAMVIGMLFIGIASAAVFNTPHNLGSSGPGTYKTMTTDQVCVFCHTPHGASDESTGVPLWNRKVDPNGFTMYSSPTMDMIQASAPQGVSLACLSCHDGTLAFDSIFNGPTATPGDPDYSPTAASRGWSFGAGSNLGMSAASVGKDLRADHPISITYDPTRDISFQPASFVLSSGLRLYGPNRDQVECASCHNPHDNTNPPFLRISNAASAMCTTCHNI